MRRLLAALTAALLACAGLAVLGPAQAAPPPIITCGDLPTAVAHRGGDELYTENTLLAFQSSGATIWETDVRFDSVNVPVILHDPTVDRTTPATGKIADLQASGTVRIPTDDGQQIPTLWEILDAADKAGARVLLELKVMPASPVQWNALFNRIDITIGRSRVTLASFDTAVLDAVRDRDPTMATAWIDEWGDPGTAAILAQGQAYLKYAPAFTKARYAAWHAAGVELYAWTVDNPLDWPRLVNYPVDALITDKPLALAAWLRLRCPAPTATPTPPAPSTVPVTTEPPTNGAR
jgi:glycerophosphoryl diester phosphodiesterase